MKRLSVHKTSDADCYDVSIIFIHELFLAAPFPWNKRIDNELTHSRVFLLGKCFPKNSYPKCAPQFSHSISVLIPSGSGIRFIAFLKLSSKLGHPHPVAILPSASFDLGSY